MSMRSRARRRRRKARELALKTMEHWIAEAKEHGVKNPEVMETLTASGCVSSQHPKAIKKLRAIQNSNRHNPDGNYNQQRHWEKRQKIIESNTKWLEARGFRLNEVA